MPFLPGVVDWLSGQRGMAIAASYSFDPKDGELRTGLNDVTTRIFFQPVARRNRTCRLWVVEANDALRSRN
jgi:hypothetical protein